MPESDEKLFASYMRGDERGLRTLMERYGDSLTLYINGYIHDFQDSEDLMIEAFSRVLAKRPLLKEGGFRPYLYKTARNLALRFTSKQRRGDFSFDNLETEPEADELVDAVVHNKERDYLLKSCLDSILPDYREAIFLVFFEDMSYAQAAKVMGKSPKQVDNLIQRGKKALRPLLEKEGITDAFS
jgi:RNA polymerase sigma factor (sigma-70 family)